MTLPPGTRLGPYEISAQIGVGGMGEVYKATDTKLKRQVAIKVLPASVAADAERLARFQREAEVLAALNHPNIAAIYGLEDAAPSAPGAGAPAAAFKALVMELVEGPTLADRIADGAIPVAEALPIAKQIAEALEAAHEQGIIHRDLKPANVKVRPDGTVKVLDFGLAKAMEPAGALATSQSLSPTITTPAMTQAGMILGTAAYMSPEQARGRTVDKRTDIWAFGVVLYEMLTGTRAFDSEDLSLTLADVMRAEPAWERLPADLSPSLVSVLRRCLRKDPKERLRDIGDVRLALDGAFEAGAVPGGGAAAATSGAFRAARWRVLATGVAGLLVGGLVATLAWMAGAPAALPGEVRHASMVLTTQDGTLAALAENQVPALDGAGRVLVVRASGTNPLLARRFDRADAVPLPGTEGASSVAVSPDGAWVAFVANRQLQKVSMSGGAPATLLAAPDVTPGIAWAGTDSLIIGGRSGLVRVPAGGGAAEQVTTVDAGAGEVDHRTPFVTLDGAILAYTVWMGSADTSRVRVRDLRSGVDRTLMLGQHPTVTPTGHLVFGRDSSLWAAPFDPDTLEVGREAVPVLDGVNSSLSATTYYALSGDGTLVYASRLERAAPVARLDRTGTSVGAIGEPFAGVHHGPPALSPDGALLAICRHPVGGQDQVVIHDVRRGRTMSVGGTGDSRYPVWTKDGTRLAFMSTRNGTRDIFEVAAGRPGDPQPLLVRPGDQIPGSWTPDGGTLAYTEVGPSPGVLDIWLLPRDGDPSPLLANPAFSESGPAFSLDGTLLAYTSNESGQPEVYVQAYPSGGSHAVVSSGGGRRPAWARDGLYYEDLNGRVFFMPFAEGGAQLAEDTPQRLMETMETRVSGDAATWGVSSDGQTFFAFQDLIAPPGSLELVLNWHEELKRLVPVD